MKSSPRRLPSSSFTSSMLNSLVTLLLLTANDVAYCQPHIPESPSAYSPAAAAAAADVVGGGDASASVATYPLKSGSHIPLVGMGIGNLSQEYISRSVRHDLSLGVRLIDTARKSNNEAILARAISAWYDDDADVVDDGGSGSRSEGAVGERSSLRSSGGKAEEERPSVDLHDDINVDDDDIDPIHVVTKVWYTHLGYDRTKLSVDESLNELSLPITKKTDDRSGRGRRLHVHLLLHWPRCYDDISWMECEREENELPEYVRDAGSPPHLDKDNAFKESWRALEDIFLQRDEMVQYDEKDGTRRRRPYIASIGVSNFRIDDMRQLLDMARVPPHVYQGDSWMVFNDADMMDLLTENEIFFQAYSVFGRILAGEENAPRAYEVLSDVTREVLSSVYPLDVDHAEVHSTVTVATVLLAFFFQYSVGVIPRSSSHSHQRQNSPDAVASVARHLTTNHVLQLEKALLALMNGRDNNVVTVSFVNALTTAIQVHWIHPDTHEEHLVSNIIHPGSVEAQDTYPGHRFVAYDPDRQLRREFVVEADYGERQYFNVEL